MGFSGRNVTNIVLAVAAVAAAAGGVAVALGDRSPDGVEIVLPTPSRASEAAFEVYVSGAVARPGVYVVSPGDRLMQVVEAAGGATADADMAAVNLAARVGDEDHWHIPAVGEAQTAVLTQASDTSGRLDLNTAGAGDLMSLPGIGEVKARTIIEYREASGPFASVDGLLDVRGIGPATLEAIRGLVEVQ